MSPADNGATICHPVPASPQPVKLAGLVWDGGGLKNSPEEAWTIRNGDKF